MNIIKAGYEFIPEQEGFLSLCKKIELVARTCYKSEDLITETSCIKMIENLIKRKHYAMLEHASLVFKVDRYSYYATTTTVLSLQNQVFEGHEYETFKSYLRFTEDGNNDSYIISGNIRAWIEFLQMSTKIYNKIPFFFKGYLDNRTAINTPTDEAILFHEFLDVPGDIGFAHFHQVTDFSELTIRERLIHQDLSVKFTVDRGVTHELVRMRDCSFAQESTRFCNYSKGKFGEEITVINPCFFDTGMGARSNSLVYDAWRSSCEVAEEKYFELLGYDATPQQARDVLSTSVKADIIMTTNIREWIHILELRALGVTGKPHPQMEEVMVPLAKELATGLLSDFTCIDSVNKMLSL